MLWKSYKVVFFVAMSIAAACGILFLLVPEYLDVLGMIATISLAVGIIPLLGIIAVMFFIWACDSIEKMGEWTKKRNWGYVFTFPGAVGLMLLVCLDGPDVIRAHAETDTRIVIFLVVITLALLGTGWLINHFPSPSPTRIVRDWSQYDS